MAEHGAVRPKNDPVRLGVYRHYKHTDKEPKFYLVIGLARHTETEQSLVIYIPLYHAGGLRMAARPLSNFIGKIQKDGEWIDRFAYIGTEIPEYSVRPRGKRPQFSHGRRAILLPPQRHERSPPRRIERLALFNL